MKERGTVMLCGTLSLNSAGYPAGDLGGQAAGALEGFAVAARPAERR
ncbi:hypothetical protein [Paenibacillus rhizophilus]|nr:hypothetical protein [Paenibacillus rhizophilus]